MAIIAHPHLEPAELLALQSSAGWRMAIELIDGEAVVIPPSGAAASSVQGELFYALRSWQEVQNDWGLLLRDVFVELPGHLATAAAAPGVISPHKPERAYS